jgi:4-hydroxy-tetrahydrodipicolinate reductase
LDYEVGVKMKLALIGYGKMGQEIEKVAIAKDIAHIKIDPNEQNCVKEINKEVLDGVDVCVDFTHPDNVIENIKKIAEYGKNIVVGTTGWYNKMDEVKNIVAENNIGLIWSGNFSIGVNAYLKIIKNASKLMNKINTYDVYVHEFHHNQKADSPSGTAIMIGDVLIKNIERKNKIVTEQLKRKINPDELHISSTRAGKIPGTHVVGFDSAADSIELKHIARNRQGFALGAVMAARWIQDKKGFFNIDDMLDDMSQ